MAGLVSVGLIVGRVALASLFLLAGLNKVMNYEATLAAMTEAGLAPAGVLLPAVIALEIGGGALVAVGRRFAALAALALALFTLATNIVFHDFWTMTGAMRATEQSLFFKNVSIAGGLFFLAAHFGSRSDRRRFAR